jgi:small subunit ribosomal protein S20
MRQAVRRAARNQSARSAVRTYVKKATQAVAGSVAEAADIVREAVSALDKAAQKGIVHRNAASRRKSRLMSRLHRLSVPQAPSTESETKAKAPARRGTSPARGGAGQKPGARKPAPTSSARRTTRAKD